MNQAAALADDTNGRNLRTVSMPGFEVAPLRTFQSVLKGTPETFESSCTCAYESASSVFCTSAPLGICWTIPEDIGFDTVTQSNSVALHGYRAEMDDPPLKDLIWLNVTTLMTRRYGGPNITRLGRDTGIATGGAQRLEGRAEVGPTILEKVAQFFEVHAWQLLAPNLGESMLLSKEELEAVRKMREPLQPKNVLRISPVGGPSRPGIRKTVQQKRRPAVPKKKGP